MQGFSTSTGILTIDLGALAANYQIFQDKVSSNCAVAGVIKANAYGLGLKEIALTLKTLNCPQFFVATLEEALKIREFDQQTPIAVLGGLFTNEEKTYTTHNITPVLNSPVDIQSWKKWGQEQNKALPAFLHIDTGMNRLGLSGQEFNQLLDAPNSLESIDVQYVMSHFVSADDWAEEWAQTLTIKQAEQFNEQAVRLKKIMPNLKKSLANSPGLFRDSAFHHDMVRPGYALYGGNPTPEKDNPMQPVVSLNTRILQIRECQKHETVGYGASYKFEKDARTATIALGYADGFLRSISNNGVVYYNNQACPVIGRVSMDLVTIDISQIKGKAPQQGDSVEILGPHQSVDDLAKAARTIGYEILTSLGNRYKRKYVGA